MNWVKITRIEKSKYNSSRLAYFNFQGRERFTVITDNVLRINKITDIYVGLEIFVIKSFNNQGEQLFYMKNVRSN